MRVFLTGGTGFVGGAVAGALADAGHEVAALVRDPARGEDLQSLGASLHPGDITRKETLAGPMEGVDAVCHVAGWYQVGVRDQGEAWRVNVLGTQNVLETMRDLDIPRGVYTSTLAVFSDTHGEMKDETYRYEGPHLSVYDRTKWLAHYEVAEPLMREGLPLTIVMPGIVYGPGDRGPLRPVILQYLQGRLRILPRGSGYCWGHVEDMARAHLQALEKGRPGESYIIAGPPHTVEEAFDLAERVTGIPAPRRRLSPRTLRLLAGLAAVAGRLAFWSEGNLAETLRVGAGVTYLGSNEKARRELGVRPRPLEEGWPETLEVEKRRLGLA